MLTRFHAYLGLVMLLPLFIWAVTGAVFLVKPGYDQAFAPLAVKPLPLEKRFALPADSAWVEARYLRTMIGWHLLVVEPDGQPRHLNPQTLEPWPFPILELIKKLMNDAIAHDPERYGTVETLRLNESTYTATTTTAVELELDWNTLTMSQSGGDSRFINRLYRLHYLQWLPHPVLNKVLAIAGILGLLVMCVVSFKMLISVHKWE